MRHLIAFFVLLVSVYAVCGQPTEYKREDVSELLSNPAFVAALYDFMEAQQEASLQHQLFGNRMMVNKRNSELLNSLLGLPRNILRSGK